MKKIIFYFTIVLFILSACDPLEKVYKELDAKDTGYKNSVVYTLLPADYSTIAKSVTVKADSLFLTSKKYFTDLIPAATYIPPFLANKYPALKLGSSAMVTYNYNGVIPEDLGAYTTTDADTLSNVDYESVDGALQIAQYFSPGYPPELYLPGILADKIASPAAGDLVRVNYKYSTVDPIIDYAHMADILLWEETFSGNTLGTFTAFNILGTQSWYGTSYAPDEYAYINGFSSVNDNEDWLISGAIDLTGVSNASFVFRETAKYVNGHWEQLGVLVSSNWDGTEPGISAATWDLLGGYTLPTGGDYFFVESGKIDFSSYANKTIHVAFRYLSTTTNAAKWEIDWAKIVKPGTQPPVIGLAPKTINTFYQFTGGLWTKASNVYYLNADDYNAMGAPGKYDNFDLTMPPQNYLPAMLYAKFPLAGQSSEIVVVYKYYEGTTMTLADKYVFNNGVWTSTYNFVEPRASQFLYSNTGWVFDPTVTFTMTAADYQIIVDWVKNNIVGDYMRYGDTQEYYTGAGSGYKNFDIRPDKWEENIFSKWEDAVAFGIGTALLPSKYPAAVTQVSGIDVMYLVSFQTYSGTYANYTWKFQCTKAGPDPEFTLVP